ncbi:synaptic plasticity regulator PANTS isoform X1 [Chroicocephalus ridibundus]|uniref:synaptic plasticity regulator PANTS isoform X1 n=1 Tax=Chroicocephalus ridibundus TaxID=1192867 RepID=UPI002FDCE905
MAGGEGWRPPRPCEDYWWEWKHCRGLRHAFHHYYAHGELPACGRWRDDYEACRAWERGRTAAAQVRQRCRLPGRSCTGGPGALRGHAAPSGTGCSITRPPSRRSGGFLRDGGVRSKT